MLESFEYFPPHHKHRREEEKIFYSAMSPETSGIIPTFRLCSGIFTFLDI